MKKGNRYGLVGVAATVVVLLNICLVGVDAPISNLMLVAILGWGMLGIVFGLLAFGVIPGQEPSIHENVERTVKAWGPFIKQMKKKAGTCEYCGASK